MDVRWKNILEEIVLMPEFIIERSAMPEDCVGPPEIFNNWDGGTPAFGAMVYLRYARSNSSSGQTHSVKISWF